MKRITIGLLIAALGLACGRGEDRSGSAGADRGARPDTGATAMHGMPGMEGREGMSMAGDTGGVPIDREKAARLGITFARTSRASVRPTIRVVGALKYAEPNRVYLNARVNGWVEKLYADYEGKPVKAGDSLLALYSPELVSAQEEYLLARRLGDDSLAAGARRRLALWDISPDQLDSLDARGTITRTLLLRAPRSGEIVEKMVIEGQAIRAGDNLFQIADRRVLWVDLAVFEQDAAAVRVGTPVQVTVDALPGRSFPARVSFLQPTLDEKTRTLTARTEVNNASGQLRPGMYATAEISVAARNGLSVPTAAVLPTGTKDLVFVNRGDGRFLPREVKVGLRGDSLIEIVQGLKPGEEVVASATFLLDSESNLAAAIQGIMLQMGMGLNMGGMDMGKRRRHERSAGEEAPPRAAAPSEARGERGGREKRKTVAPGDSADSVDMPGMPGMKMPRLKP